MNRYEEPGQRLHSHNWSNEYKDNYEKIFGKKETWLERREREALVRTDTTTEKLNDENGSN